jgi:hypothetical protein
MTAMWRSAWHESMNSWPCNIASPGPYPRDWLCFGHGRSSYSREYRRDWRRNHREQHKLYQRAWKAKRRAATLETATAA